MKKCKICGLELQDEEKSCSKCGGKQFIKISEVDKVDTKGAETEKITENTVIIEKKKKKEYEPPIINNYMDIVKMYLTYLIPVYGWAKLLEVVIRVESKSKEEMFIRVNFVIFLTLLLIVSILINVFGGIIVRI